jgi:hypothetical protein
MSWSQPIWVLMEPVFQMRWSMPCALKKEYSSAVAPVMAKLAPFLKSLPCACDGGGSGSPKCSAAEVAKDPHQKKGGDFTSFTLLLRNV